MTEETKDKEYLAMMGKAWVQHDGYGIHNLGSLDSKLDRTLHS